MGKNKFINIKINYITILVNDWTIVRKITNVRKISASWENLHAREM